MSKKFSPITFDTPKIENYQVPHEGIYKIECWGAGGGNTTYTNTLQPGRGAYATGVYKTRSNDLLVMTIGGVGSNGNSSSGGGGGFPNGGGGGSDGDESSKETGGGGGGCTTVHNTSVVLLTSGGGGGTGHYQGSDGGHAGYLEGQSGGGGGAGKGGNATLGSSGGGGSGYNRAGGNGGIVSPPSSDQPSPTGTGGNGGNNLGRGGGGGGGNSYVNTSLLTDYEVIYYANLCPGITEGSIPGNSGNGAVRLSLLKGIPEISAHMSGSTATITYNFCSTYEDDKELFVKYADGHEYSLMRSIYPQTENAVVSVTIPPYPHKVRAFVAKNSTYHKEFLYEYDLRIPVVHIDESSIPEVVRPLSVIHNAVYCTNMETSINLVNIRKEYYVNGKLHNIEAGNQNNHLTIPRIYNGMSNTISYELEVKVIATSLTGVSSEQISYKFPNKIMENLPPTTPTILNYPQSASVGVPIKVEWLASEDVNDTTIEYAVSVTSLSGEPLIQRRTLETYINIVVPTNYHESGVYVSISAMSEGGYSAPSKPILIKVGLCRVTSITLSDGQVSILKSGDICSTKIYIGDKLRWDISDSSTQTTVTIPPYTLCEGDNKMDVYVYDSRGVPSITSVILTLVTQSAPGTKGDCSVEGYSRVQGGQYSKNIQLSDVPIRIGVSESEQLISLENPDTRVELKFVLKDVQLRDYLKHPIKITGAVE